MEITTIADIPVGTRLGSSGSFTTVLLKALHKHKRSFITPRELAEQACHIELELLNDPIGKQDQYIAAFGGLTAFEFKNDEVKVRPLKLSEVTYHKLVDHLVLFATRQTCVASSILKEQDDKTKRRDPDMVNNLHYVKDLGERSLEALESGDLDKFG